jgi:hypothetical protein
MPEYMRNAGKININLLLFVVNDYIFGRRRLKKGKMIPLL